MKKTLLALAVAAVATSAQAKIELYKDDVKEVTIKGEADVYLNILDETSKTVNNVTTTTDEDVNVDFWAYSEVGYSHQLTDTLKGFASFEMEYSPDDDGKKVVVFDDVYVGFSGDFGTIKGGETADSLSVIGYMTDITNEGTYAYDSNIESKGKGLRYENSFGDFYFSTDIQTTNNVDDEINVGASYAIGGFTLAAAFSDGGQDDQGADVGTVGVGASFEHNGLYLAALFATFEGGYEQTDSDFAKGDIIGAAASYSFNDFRLYSSLAAASDDNSDNNASSVSVGLDYAVHGDITVFVEYTGTSKDINDEESDKLLTGIYYAF